VVKNVMNLTKIARPRLEPSGPSRKAHHLSEEMG
jgi:hypothetical protein